jgi:hypothetical protein
MKNPNPILRARRIEMRRKELGYATRCFYCEETNIACFEVEHPVTKDLDEQFKRAVCRNCHRKLELSRDVKKLTTNGQHDAHKSKHEGLRRYLLLLAEDQDSIADHMATNPPEMTTKALRGTAASLRRKAEALS